MSDYREAVVALLGIATAVMGWLYARRTGLERVREELLAAMEQRYAAKVNLDELKLEDLDRRLRACEERWKRWSGGPIG